MNLTVLNNNLDQKYQYYVHYVMRKLMNCLQINESNFMTLTIQQLVSNT